MNKEQKTIVQLYAVFSAGILMNFIPSAVVQIFALCLLIVVLIAAYIYKAKAKLDSLMYNHTTYLIGTIWASSLLLFIGMVIATFWVYEKGDHALIETIITGMNDGVMFTEKELAGIFSDYVHQNLTLLLTATVSTLGPGLIYMIYRVSKGTARALKGHRVAKPASWF